MLRFMSHEYASTYPLVASGHCVEMRNCAVAGVFGVGRPPPLSIGQGEQTGCRREREGGGVGCESEEKKGTSRVQR